MSLSSSISISSISTFLCEWCADHNHYANQVNPAFFFDDDTDANTKLCMDLFAKEMSFKEYRLAHYPSRSRHFVGHIWFTETCTWAECQNYKLQKFLAYFQNIVLYQLLMFCHISHHRETGVHRIKFHVPEKTETIKLVNLNMLLIISITSMMVTVKMKTKRYIYIYIYIYLCYHLLL